MARRKPKKKQKVNLAKLSLTKSISLVQQLVQQSRIDDAENVLQWLRTKHGDKLEILNALTIILVHKRRYEEAKQCIKLAINKAPSNPDLHNNLGNIYKLDNDIQNAELAYKDALAFAPKHLDALNNLANIQRLKGEHDAALKGFNQAISINPHFEVAHFNKANVLSSMNEHAAAIESFDSAIGIKPDFYAAYNSLGLLHYKLGQLEQSAEVYRRLLRACPGHAVGEHMLAAVTNKDAPVKASEKYIETVFDEFAESFDNDLKSLHYRAPELVAQTVADKYAENAGLQILDAGCGTGLCGPLLAAYKATLTGVDLSAKMIAKTKNRGYDSVIVAEITDYLTTQAGHYDLIVSADTFNYFGDLTDVFSNSFAALKAGGRLVFTLEHDEDINIDQGFKLTHSGRYSHCRSYVDSQLSAAHFVAVEFTQGHLRIESGKPVIGLIVTAEKPS